MRNAVLFGASNLGREVFDNIRTDVNVKFFCDNDPNKWGDKFCGVPVISPADLLTRSQKDDFVIITSSFRDEIELQLKKMEIDNFYYYANIPYARGSEDFDSAVSSINDEISLNNSSVFSATKLEQEKLNRLMDDQIYVDSRWKPIQISSWDNVWNINPYNNNTWRLRLHILQPISYLLRAYKFSRD